ncbi:MAG: hypothetical protein JSS86_18145 [Cyanobacteria bacterium SZAS LIN-2]|nr:hypothetical protein [Cyanobacteria bacterium SZAS LIN-2]
MTSIKWVFEQSPEMGGVSGEGFTNPLLGSGMEPAADLAREVIQNSTDAQVAGEKVRVEMRRVTLTGKEKQAFVKAMGLDPALTSRRNYFNLPRGSCLETLADAGAPLHLLYIEDYGTCGLYGSPKSRKSHFNRLLLSLGDGSKSTEAEGSGGSYGFGKSACSSNSRIHTIVAYTVFDPAKSGVAAKNHARLMGCGYFRGHDHKEVEYTGRAWYGTATDGGKVDPLVDEDAHEYAERLGFKRRDLSERGTSLLIVDCGVDCEMLRDAIEEWWWPRLLDDELGLDVALYEQGQRLAPPRPRKRPDLRPFIECFDLAIGRSMPTGEHQKTAPFNRLYDRHLGNYAYTVVGEEGAKDEKLGEKLGSIALIRRPRMVIEYMNVGGSLPLPCVGTFVAGPDIDNFLKRSEPATHNKWDPKSNRLSELGPEARDIVVKVLQRLKTGLRHFANAAMPQAPTQELRLKSLERLLGNMFKPPTTSSGGGGASPGDPISINFVDQPHIVAEQAGIATKGSFRVSLADEADRPKVKVAVRVKCLVQEDEGVTTEDPIAVTLHSNEVNGSGSVTADGGIVFELERDAKPLFTFKSAAYVRDWTTHVQVHVEEM